MKLNTPYYLIDENRMRPAMEKIRCVYQQSGAKSVLALKCFSSWCAFDFMSQYMAGSTSSSLYEARLGYEKFPGETHAYSVAFDEQELEEVIQFCDKIIFNSLSQLHQYKHKLGGLTTGLRLNPEIGCSHYALSNPVGRYSRLGAKAGQLPANIDQLIDGAMFHMNCENDDFDDFNRQLSVIEDRFAEWLPQFSWLSLGGGVAFTKQGYPLDAFCARLKKLATDYGLQIYLEPGEAAVTQSTSLCVKVLDIVDNDVPTLIVNAGVETHALDVLVYQFTPELLGATAITEEDIPAALAAGKPVYRVAGRTCLAGDIFGTYIFDQPQANSVAVGTELTFPDMAGYTMVKKNFFNGVSMPGIYHKNIDGVVREVQRSTYQDFKHFLS